MQRRLHHLQNPKDCSSARKLVCSLSKACGFGCQMHHAMYCFIVAYGTERTLILQSGGMYVCGEERDIRCWVYCQTFMIAVCIGNFGVWRDRL